FYQINRNSNPFRIKQLNNNITPSYQWNFYDQAYFDTNDYFTDPNKNSIYYPFRQPIDKKERLVDIDNLQGKNLATLNSDQIDWNKSQYGLIDYLSENKNIGSFVELPDINHDIGLKIGFESKNITGMPLRICFKNIYNNLCVIYEELGKNKDFAWDYYLLPPMDNFSGYNISIDNISLGDYQTHNQIKSITIDKVDFDSYFKNKSQDINPNPEPVIYPKSNRLSSFLYQISIPNNLQNQTLIFSSTYNQDWKAFYFSGLKPIFLKDHILINNWANGWAISDLKNQRSNALTLYIVFWPQLLQFLGLILLIPTFIWIFKNKN
ncbi:MAG: hypothetical protein WCX20_02655, partial [Candidatus Shapirobacteria bacterium]